VNSRSGIALPAPRPARVLLIPAVVLALLTAAITGALVGGGGCGGDGGPGGGSQQIGPPHLERRADRQRPNHHLGRGGPPAAPAGRGPRRGHRDRRVHPGQPRPRRPGLPRSVPTAAFQGWGTPAQILNPSASAGVFYDHLLALPGWRACPPGPPNRPCNARPAPTPTAPKSGCRGPSRQVLGRARQPGAARPRRPSRSAATGRAGRVDRVPGPGRIEHALDPSKLPPGFVLPTDPRQRAAVVYALGQLGSRTCGGPPGPPPSTAPG